MYPDRQLDNLKTQIRPHLTDLILEHGVEISKSGMMSCIDPMHADRTPSMKILGDLNSEVVYCYTCHAHGDIFTVNEWLNGVPSTGLGFIKENLYALADKYDIPYTEIEFSEEQIEVFDRIKVNKAACRLMAVRDEDDKPINWTDGHAIARGWQEAACRTLNIRTVLDYNCFIRDLSRATGVDPSELKDKYDFRSTMFGPESITIPIFDEMGQAVGFTARWLNWKRKEKRPKYTNSHNSPAFHKNRVLYGMHLSKRAKGKRLDLFEGNGSFVTAYGSGHKSCTALMSSSISDEQITLIQRMGFSHVNLVLDGDAAGKEKTDKYMQSLSGREGLRITSTQMPDGIDPDTFIIDQGLNEFYKLGVISAFEYMLTKHIEEATQGDVPKFVSKMLKIILNTANRIERGQQIKALANVVDIPEEDIRDEMQRLCDLSVDQIRDDLSSSLRYAKDTDEILSIMARTKTTVEETSGTRNERQNLSATESLENFNDLVTTLRNKKPGIQGWVTGFSILDDRLSGIKKPTGLDDNGKPIPQPGVLIGLGGAPQHGKSTLLLNLCYNMARLNDDISVLYWVLDDSREATYERLIAMDSGVEWAAVTKRREPTPLELEKIDESTDRIAALIASGKLVLKDQTNGRSIPMVQRWVENSYKDHSRPICLAIDSFHKISSVSSQASLAETAKAKAHSEELKSLYKTHNLTIICSLEVNKAAQRGIEPDMLNITETRKIEFDFDIVAMVFNHYHDTDGDSTQFLPDGDRVRPIIKVNIRKSKEGGTGALFFALDTRTFRMNAYSLDDIRRLTETEDLKETPIAGGNISSPDKGQLTSAGTGFIEPWN